MIKQTSLTIAAIVIASVAVVAVAIGLFLYPYSPDNPPFADDKNASQSGIRQVVDANNQFAFDLYNELKGSEEGNIFYSPYSMSAALSMTYEGARGQTSDEIKKVLHFPNYDILRPNFASIYNEINKKGKPYELRTGNALWVQKDFRLLDDYLWNVEKYYGGKAANVDFIEETEKSRQTINSFIEEQTSGRIKNLIPEGMLNPMTRLVLTNAIYFKGTWEWEFDKSRTKKEDFFITPENKIEVDMMNMNPDKTTFNYMDNGQLQMIELPYKGDDLSMLILLPKDNLDSIDKFLTADNLKGLKDKMGQEHIDAISIPKFEFDTKYFMDEELREMGMPTAFSGDADFSGIDGNKDLYIAFVIHQAFVKVDEEGTEAAAATAVGMKLTSAVGPQDSLIFRADHPFIFLIQEKNTGNILFIGRVTNPNS